MAATNSNWWRNSSFSPKPYQNHVYNPVSETCTKVPQKNINRSISYGVILCRGVGDNIKYAIVRKRVSYGVPFILEGRWKQEYFTEISKEEKCMFERICQQDDGWENAFDHLWNESKGCRRKSAKYQDCRDNICRNRAWLLSMFQSSTLIFPDGVWEFPKGRMDSKDASPQHCALRELEEETGISKSSVKLIDMGSYVETYNKIWISCYYVGKICEEHSFGTFNSEECSEMKWCSYDEAITLIPSVVAERLRILTSVHSRLIWMGRTLKV
jgi:8-oxo-dGTP pyrophosphatase MutT (NUDIX family)